MRKGDFTVKRLGTTIFLLSFVLALLWSAARAEYGSSSRTKVGNEGSFEEAVDLKKFRQGNPDWDTQELLKSGLTALHREHEQILIRLAEIKASLEQLEGER